MAIFWILVIGLVAGVVAELLMRSENPGGIIITILLGIVGAFLGALAPYLGHGLGWYELPSLDPYRAMEEGQQAGFIGAVVGAVILLVIYRLVRKRS